MWFTRDRYYNPDLHINIIYLMALSDGSGWSFDEVLPFFKASEDNRDYSTAKDTLFHSVGGPQPVSRPKFITPLGTAFLVKEYSLS